MMGKIRLGPAAILLTGVSICLAVLAILTLATAEADWRITNRYAQTVQEWAAREETGQRFLGQVAEMLREGEDIRELDGVTMAGENLYETRIRTERDTLEICLEVTEDGSVRIRKWQTRTDWTEQSDWENLWDGK